MTKSRTWKCVLFITILIIFDKQLHVMYVWDRIWVEPRDWASYLEGFTHPKISYSTHMQVRKHTHTHTQMRNPLSHCTRPRAWSLGLSCSLQMLSDDGSVPRVGVWRFLSICLQTQSGLVPPQVSWESGREMSCLLCWEEAGNSYLESNPDKRLQE